MSSLWFLDIETSGLDSAVDSVSCVGLSRVVLGSPFSGLVVQFSGGDEALVLSDFLAFVHGNKFSEAKLITFNGSSFDLSFLRARCEKNGLVFVEPGEHVDLFPICTELFGRKRADGSRNFVSKDLACEYCGVYVPRTHSSVFCALVGGGRFVSVDGWARVCEHNLVDLCATELLYYKLRELGVVG